MRPRKVKLRTDSLHQLMTLETFEKAVDIHPIWWLELQEETAAVFAAGEGVSEVLRATK